MRPITLLKNIPLLEQPVPIYWLLQACVVMDREHLQALRWVLQIHRGVQYNRQMSKFVKYLSCKMENSLLELLLIPLAHWREYSFQHLVALRYHNSDSFSTSNWPWTRRTAETVPNWIAMISPTCSVRLVRTDNCKRRQCAYTAKEGCSMRSAMRLKLRTNLFSLFQQQKWWWKNVSWGNIDEGVATWPHRCPIFGYFYVGIFFYSKLCRAWVRARESRNDESYSLLAFLPFIS